MSSNFTEDTPIDQSEEIGLWDDDVDFDIMSDKEAPPVNVMDVDTTAVSAPQNPHTIDQLMNNDPVENAVIEHETLKAEPDLSEAFSSEVNAELQKDQLSEENVENRIEEQVAPQTGLQMEHSETFFEKHIDVTSQSVLEKQKSSDLNNLFETDDKVLGDTVSTPQHEVEEAQAFFNSIATNGISEQVPAIPNESFSAIDLSNMGLSNSSEIQNPAQKLSFESPKTSMDEFSNTQSSTVTDKNTHNSVVNSLNDKSQDSEKSNLENDANSNVHGFLKPEDRLQEDHSGFHEKKQDESTNIANSLETNNTDADNNSNENNDFWLSLSENKDDGLNIDKSTNDNDLTVNFDDQAKSISDILVSNHSDMSKDNEIKDDSTVDAVPNIPQQKTHSVNEADGNFQNAKKFDSIFSDDEEEEEDFLASIKVSKENNENILPSVDASNKSTDKFGFLDDDEDDDNINDSNSEETNAKNLSASEQEHRASASVVSSGNKTVRSNRYVPQTTPSSVENQMKQHAQVGITPSFSISSGVDSYGNKISPEQQSLQNSVSATRVAGRHNVSKYAPTTNLSPATGATTQNDSVVDVPSSADISVSSQKNISSNVFPPKGPQISSNKLVKKPSFFQDAPIMANEKNTTRKSKAELKKQKELIRQQKKLREQQSQHGVGGIPLISVPPSMYNNTSSPAAPPQTSALPQMNNHASQLAASPQIRSNQVDSSPMVSMTQTLPILNPASPMKSDNVRSPLNSPQKSVNRSMRKSSTASRYAPPQQPQQPPVHLQKSNTLTENNVFSTTSARSSSVSSQQNDPFAFPTSLISGNHHPTHHGYPHLAHSPRRIDANSEGQHIIGMNKSYQPMTQSFPMNNTIASTVSAANGFSHMNNVPVIDNMISANSVPLVDNSHMENLPPINNMPLINSIPPINNNMPPINSNMPPINNNMPPINNNMPPINNNMPPINNNMPPINNNMPPINNINLPPINHVNMSPINNMPPINNNMPPINTMSPTNNKASDNHSPTAHILSPSKNAASINSITSMNNIPHFNGTHSQNNVQSNTSIGSFVPAARKSSIIDNTPLASNPAIAGNVANSSSMNGQLQAVPMNVIQQQSAPRLPIETYLSMQIPIFKFCNQGKFLMVKSSTDSINGNSYLSMSTTKIQIDNLKSVIDMDKSIATYPVEPKKHNAQNLSKWISDKIKTFEEGKDASLANAQYDQENILLILKIFNNFFENSSSSNNSNSMNYKTIARLVEVHFGFDTSSGYIGGMTNTSRQKILSGSEKHSSVPDGSSLNNLLASLGNSTTLGLASQTQDFALSLLYSGLFKKETFMSSAENYINHAYNLEHNDTSMLIYFFFKSFINIGSIFSSITPAQTNFLKTYWFHLLSLILHNTNDLNISIVKNILIQYSNFFESINFNKDNRCQINYILAMVPVELVNFKSDNISYVILLDIYIFILEKTGTLGPKGLQTSKKFIEKNIQAYIGDFENSASSDSSMASIAGGWFGSKSKIDLSYQFNKFISGEDNETCAESSVFDKIVPKSKDHPKSLVTSVNGSLNPSSPLVSSPFTPIGGTRNMRNALLNHSLYDNTVISPPLNQMSQFGAEYAQRSNSSPNIATFSPNFPSSVSASPVKNRSSRYPNKPVAPSLQQSNSDFNLSNRNSRANIPSIANQMDPSSNESKNLLEATSTDIAAVKVEFTENDSVFAPGESSAKSVSQADSSLTSPPVLAPPPISVPPSVSNSKAKKINESTSLPTSAAPISRRTTKKNKSSRYLPSNPSKNSNADLLSQYQDIVQSETVQNKQPVIDNIITISETPLEEVPASVISADNSLVNHSFEANAGSVNIIKDNNISENPAAVNNNEDISNLSVLGSRVHSRNNSLRSSKFNPVDSSSFANISDINEEISFSKAPSSQIARDNEKNQEISNQFSAFEPVTHDDIAESLKIQQMKHRSGSINSEAVGLNQHNVYSLGQTGGSRMPISGTGYNRNVSGRSFGMFDDTASLSRFRKPGSISSVGTSNYIATYRQDDTIYEEDDDEVSEDEEEVSILNREKLSESKSVPKNKSDQIIKSKKENDDLGNNSISRKSSGWFDWLGREKAGANGKKVYKAKLGEENSFYYDETLKRWINKKIPIEEQIVDDTPPPPPIIMKKPLSTRSAPPPSIGGQSTVDAMAKDLPPISEGGDAAALSQGRNTVKNEDAPIPSAGVPVPSIGYAKVPGSKPSAGSKKIKHDSLEDLLTKSVPRKGGKKTRKGRGYVNVMQN